MNNPSEWARFFDENTGTFRYKHKGSGVIRDTLITIGKLFKGTVKKTAEKATKTIGEKAGQKVGELAVEKGSKQIRKLLQERKKKAVSQDTKKKLANILQNQVPKKSDDALMKLNRILANEIYAQKFFLQYKGLLICSDFNHTSRRLHTSKLI